MTGLKCLTHDGLFGITIIAKRMVKVVQERLGHSSIKITIDTYNHIAPGLQEVAATRFNEAFTAGYNEREKEAVGNRY